MENDLFTVQEVVNRGFKLISLPFKIIMNASIAFSMLLLMVHFSLWDFVVLPAGAIVAFLFSAIVTPRWRIWAYEQVADIHQLQRSAELAGLLMRQSCKSTSGDSGNY